MSSSERGSEAMPHNLGTLGVFPVGLGLLKTRGYSDFWKAWKTATWETVTVWPCETALFTGAWGKKSTSLVLFINTFFVYILSLQNNILLPVIETKTGNEGVIFNLFTC